MNEGRERSADRWSGVGWIAFGIVIIILSLMMERREHLGATLLTGPGFVPLLLGSALCLLGLLLVVRDAGGEMMQFLDRTGTMSDKRALMALALMFVYSVVMVGRVPFPIATFVFVTAFIFLFNLPVSNWRRATLLAGKALLTSAIATAVIVFVFRNIFLVRLP